MALPKPQGIYFQGFFFPEKFQTPSASSLFLWNRKTRSSLFRALQGQTRQCVLSPDTPFAVCIPSFQQTTPQTNTSRIASELHIFLCKYCQKPHYSQSSSYLSSFEETGWGVVVSHDAGTQLIHHPSSFNQALRKEEVTDSSGNHSSRPPQPRHSGILRIFKDKTFIPDL